MQGQAPGSSIIPRQTTTSVVPSVQNPDVMITEPALPHTGAQPSMQSWPTHTLWCLIDGDSTPFKITCQTNTDVDDLKRLIYADNNKGILRNIDAAGLMLWKVRDI